MDLNIVGNFINPQRTQRPKEAPLKEEYHKFHPIQIPDYPHKLQLPLNIYINNAYALFSLFFIDQILNIIIQNINKFACIQNSYLK